MAGEQREVQQAVGVRSAVGVLRDAHAPDEAGAAERRPGVHSGGARDVLRGDARYLLRIGRIVPVHDLPPLVEALGTRADELLVQQSLVEDDLGDGVQEGDVRTRAGPQP